MPHQRMRSDQESFSKGKVRSCDHFCAQSIVYRYYEHTPKNILHALNQDVVEAMIDKNELIGEEIISLVVE